MVLWEALALRLAAKANIAVPLWRLESIANKPVLILKRFDRSSGYRIPFISAMSMLGARDHETRSYLEIVDALRRQGAQSAEDIKALWRRVVFNILIANTDDHLRNHGFLYEGQNGWRLAPAYDLNPVPMDIKPRLFSTAIDVDDTTGSIELALSVADYFGLILHEAQAILNEVKKAVAVWHKDAKQLGLSTTEIERMSSAFLK